MIHVAVLTLSLAGFACLSLSMGKHQREWLHRGLSRSQGLTMRWTGMASVAVALPVAILGLGPSFGTVAWFGHISFSAASVFLALVWRRRRVEKKT